MPYFIDEKNCVRKGTKDEPGEVVKCHEEHAAAVAHLRALYVNVEDADKVYVEVEGEMHEFVKGGAGSGWHRPPEGTHNAENAPNFAGGPGADREYGTESDEPPDKTRRCKCTKCGAVVILPKGKQCEDIKCPGCGGGTTQTEWREDKPAEGRGGRKPKPGQKKGVEEECPACEEAKAGQETHECTCPECDKSVYVPLGQKCNEVPCPECKTKMARASEAEASEEKAVAGAPGPTVHGEGGSLGEVASVMEGETKCKCPKCGESLPCTAKMCPHCKEKIDKVERMESDKAFISYKAADGKWRWLSISNWAVVDREAEVVSEQAYKDAIAHAQKSGQWGELDLVHVDGTDCGDCDMMFIVKSGDEPAKLGAGGTWHDTAKATRAREVIQAEPGDWGMSVKFRFNPQRKVRGIYTGDIQVLKHTILPQQMAASYGTAVVVQGGESMSKVLDEKTQDALRQLGHTEDEIAELAEKNKAAPPEEENVVEKEEATTTDAEPQEQGLLAQVKQLLGMGAKEQAPDASTPDEARKTDEVEAPATTAEPAEKAEDETDAPDERDEELKAMGVAIAQAMGEALSAELEKRDAQIAALTEEVKALRVPIEEKVEARLRDVPPVVKVAASQVGATAVAPGAQQPGNSFIKELVKGITQATEDTVGGAKYKA